MIMQKHFGKIIREKRENLHRSQQQIAEPADISERQLQNIEKGIVNPKLSTVIRLAKVLDINLEELKDDLQADEMGIYRKA